MSIFFDTDSLKQWFVAHQRDLPWRRTRDPYAIWISEIMLQQTQVTVVLPYFTRWMKRFPTVQHLAAAPQEEVIKLWEGLGYYSRARHLHIAARQIVDQFDGQLPDNENQLKILKGLGPYTIGAILSFAFHQKRAAVDGNVLRVLARYFGLDDDIARPATATKFRALAESILPDEEPWLIAEGLIEIGATICQRRANCHACPLQQSCRSFLEGTVEKRPVKTRGPGTTYLYRAVAVVMYEETFLVRRGEKGAVMADLYEFPYFAIDKQGISAIELENNLHHEWGVTARTLRVLPTVKHGFTRYSARLDPFLLVTAERKEIEGHQWLTCTELEQVPFSSGHRRIWQAVDDTRMCKALIQAG